MLKGFADYRHALVREQWLKVTEIVKQESASNSETSCLDFSCSSSEFKDDNSSNYDDRLDGGIQPYLYEPMEDTISNSRNNNDRSEEENLEKLSNLCWYIWMKSDSSGMYCFKDKECLSIRHTRQDFSYQICKSCTICSYYKLCT